MTDVTGTASPSPAGPPAGAPTLLAAPQDTKGVRTAERLLAELRVEIGRADTKASVLIGAIGVCAGALLSGAREVTPAGGPGWTLGGLGGVGGLAWALAVGFLLFATAPRYRASRWRTGLPLTYFLDIRRAARSGALPDALRGTEDDELAGLVIALGDASGIVAAKHRWIRVGLGCFALGAGVLVAAVLAGG
ncbi:Pycsar system effector family protein [Streptomyces flavidovirens]|uniref:Pycsar system effector family protein n=1 Tax=Streptomyces flavidovirens TaxID=67298 RepID=UPI0036884F2F